MRPSLSRLWTKEEEQQLLKLAGEGKPIGVIAAKLRRPPKGTYSRLRLLQGGKTAIKTQAPVTKTNGTSSSS